MAIKVSFFVCYVSVYIYSIFFIVAVVVVIITIKNQCSVNGDWVCLSIENVTANGMLKKMVFYCLLSVFCLHIHLYI